MPDTTSHEPTITLTLARLEQLHEDALRYWYLRSMAESEARHKAGTWTWRLPPEALPERATTFDEAVDLARAQSCPWCQAGEVFTVEQEDRRE